MPIKASSVSPTRHIFECDEDGESWVDIKPIDGTMEQRRGQLLATQEMTWTATGAPVQRVEVNPYRLTAFELYLTFGGGHIAIEKEDGESVVLFEKKDMTESEFRADLDQLIQHAEPARREWVDAMRRVNPAWYYPF